MWEDLHDWDLRETDLCVTVSKEPPAVGGSVVRQEEI